MGTTTSAHLLIEAFINGGLLLLAFLTLRHQRKRDRKEDEDNQVKRHEENKETLAEIKREFSERPPHIHIEENGPLHAEGMRFRPPRYGNGR